MINDISKSAFTAVPASVQKEPSSRLTGNPGEPAGKAPGMEAGDADEAHSIQDVVSGLNKMVQNLHRNLQFSVDDDSGETIIKVVDAETKELVRQIPSEEIVALRRRIKDAAGVLFQSAV